VKTPRETPRTTPIEALPPGPLAQLAEQRTFNPRVVGSIPTGPTRWHGDHHDGVPVLVLTHHVPKESRPGRVHYVTDVHACAAQARAAASDADVVVQGAGPLKRCYGPVSSTRWNSRRPVLLGQGRRLFDHLPAESTELELTRELRAADADPADRVPHLRYRIQRSPPTQTAGAN
jgi:dihydrofolate reductase